MSLSSSISNALSGLAVSSRAAQLVSSNLANAMNENYSRQEIELGSAREGGAVISGISRIVDAALLADRRNALAGLGLSSERANGARALEQIIGTPDDPSSLPAHVNSFDAALRFLESDPGSDIRLREVVSTGVALSERLGMAQTSIQSQRMSADRQIGQELETLHANLQQIVALNSHIVEANVNGRDANAFLDQRQTLIDQVSELIPLREMPRAHGAVSLVSANGMMLIEASAVSFDFTRSNLIQPHMTVENGQLSGVSVDGTAIDMASPTNALGGGRLQALFEVRDQTAPQAQDQIDAFALDLAERFHDLPGDTSAPIGAAGLFTDNGARADLANSSGLAGRLSINGSVDPDRGGEVWRLRSGLNAAVEGASADATLISDMIAALAQTLPASGTIFEHAASLTSSSAQVTANLERSESFANAQYEQLTQMQLANGVDTDSELQKLMTIETHYAANAKVIQTIDEMLATIMRIN